ncbi:MAG: DUF4998 domain-containing protein [Dysgonamonadaceae bacterium]
MKKYTLNALKKSTKRCFLIALPLFMFWMASCDDMNSIHQKYYDWGEDVYTGVVDSLKAYGGYEKVKFDWELNADPRITKTVIFWNQRADSAIINVNRAQSGRLQMTYQLENLSEGDYIFEFITRDNEGHFSLPKEIVTKIYGEKYEKTLRNRRVSSILHLEDGSMLVQWDPISSVEIQYVTIKYETEGVEQSIRVENEDTETILTGLNTGDKIQVSTTYIPKGALDELNALNSEYTMPTFERIINKAKFSKLVMAGDNTSVNGVRDLSKIWDGAISNPGILHTIENAPGFNFPHHFTFDMGVSAKLSRFRIWPRTDAGAFTGHSPKNFEIWGTNELKSNSTDENYWTTDEWKNDWVLIGNHEIIRPGSDQGTAWSSGSEFKVNESINRVRYIRLIIKSNWQGSNCINIGEITLWGDDL